MIKEIECTFRECRFYRDEKICANDEVKIGRIKMLDLPVCLSMVRRECPG